MDDLQQCNAFGEEIEKVINRFRGEFDLSYASVIGILFAKAQMMTNEWSRTSEDG